MSLYYPSLNKDQTRAIWNVNLDRTEKRKGNEMTFDRVGIMDFALRHFEENKKRNTRWNGRQIRNAFQTATALAEYGAAAAQKSPATLEASHFETVAEASFQFDMYIAETMGADAAQRALSERTQHRFLKVFIFTTPHLGLRAQPIAIELHAGRMSFRPWYATIDFASSMYSQ